jgi:hypothetical protein
MYPDQAGVAASGAEQLDLAARIDTHRSKTGTMGAIAVYFAYPHGAAAILLAQPCFTTRHTLIAGTTAATVASLCKKLFHSSMVCIYSGLVQGVADSVKIFVNRA